MKKQITLTIFAVVFAFLLIGNISAFVTSSPNNLFIDLNKSYALTLLPLDNNVWNITLWIYGGNWSSFNFSWTGSQYALSILFNEAGDYPFVINSTEVTGDIKGLFYVREPFYVTFNFYKDKASTLFSSNKYVNNMAYLTAELTGDRTFFTNNYDTALEPFIAQISDSRYLKPMWHSQYINGQATLKVYEKGEYAVRLIDGIIRFDGLYSIPNITRSYGTNVYIGKYDFKNSTSYSLLLTEKDLSPYSWLFNWVFIILLVGALVVSIFLFFVIPEKPSLSIIFGLGFISMLCLIRAGLWLWKGF